MVPFLERLSHANFTPEFDCIGPDNALVQTKVNQLKLRGNFCVRTLLANYWMKNTQRGPQKRDFIFKCGEMR